MCDPLVTHGLRLTSVVAVLRDSLLVERFVIKAAYYYYYYYYYNLLIYCFCDSFI